MNATDLSDAQWCVLDLLMRAKARGVGALSRMELLRSPSLPQEVVLKLTWAALTMPKEFVVWVGQHDFSITAAGMDLYKLRFNNDASGNSPQIADAIICLPGPEHYQN